MKWVQPLQYISNFFKSGYEFVLLYAKVVIFTSEKAVATVWARSADAGFVFRELNLVISVCTEVTFKTAYLEFHGLGLIRMLSVAK